MMTDYSTSAKVFFVVFEQNLKQVKGVTSEKGDDILAVTAVYKDTS